MSPKRLALWFLIISVALTAALGIIALLSGDFGEFQIRIVLTTLTISASSILGLASGALWEGSRGKFLPAISLGFAVLAAAMTFILIWGEIDGDAFWKMTASIWVVAIATSHACLLSLAKLARRFAWALLLTFGASSLLSVLIIASIYVEPRGDFAFRLIGSLAIVVAALTILVPVFHRLSRDDAKPAATSKGPAGTLTVIKCPQCGTPQPNSLFETTCDQCGCRFVLKILAEGKNAEVRGQKSEVTGQNPVSDR